MPTPGTLAVADLAPALVFAAITALCCAAALAVVGSRRADALERQLADATSRDALTGLLDRSAAVDDITRRLARGRTPFGVLIIEIDRFETVNESYGHEVGDQLLRTIAQQLGPNLRDDETLARWVGPRFIVVAAGPRTSDEVLERASALADPLSGRIHLSHDSLPVTASVGGVAVDGGYEEASAVIEAALTALDVARDEGRASRRSFDGTLRRPVAAGSAATRMRQAIDGDELLVLYEPIVTLEGRDIAGVQAIPHWADPDRGIIPLPEWEAVLEGSGLEADVARHLLEPVVEQVAEWDRAHPDLDLVVITWTPSSLLSDPDTPYRIERMARDAGISPERICATISGRARSDLLQTWGPLREMQDMGVQLALEQFGVGWATVSYLRQFELDVLKIPAEIVSRVGQTRDDDAIVQQVIGMAGALDIVPIPEGVRSQAQADLLASSGCEVGQGPWAARPQTVDAVSAMLGRGKVVSPAQQTGINWQA